MMEIKQQSNKSVKPTSVANLLIITLTEKDMSAVSGGGRRWS